jgi:hypothetical protein
MLASFRTSAVVLIIAIACVVKFGFSPSVGANEADVPKERNPAQLNKLLTERAEVLRDYLKATKAAYDTDTVPLEQLLTAYQELLDAALEAATDPRQRVAIYESMINQAKQLETRTKALHDAGAKGGEAESYLHSKAARLRMEIGLERELNPLPTAKKGPSAKLIDRNPTSP